jgi:hypothetical protein
MQGKDGKNPPPGFNLPYFCFSSKEPYQPKPKALITADYINIVFFLGQEWSSTLLKINPKPLHVFPPM